ncbi:putative membrane protein YdjX (TVP38/TMEM64 family) [Tumebacillus sp. BK434]|uniref:TVP38/TMEM64 family protein n=1 Tax=Tumebacillus sp. BK434 TaxID=2512169 RepID=UPI00104D8203|nr:TVP38/TMEM64 family protein [Tumebacillus sp. BK434]TCP54395.1 putative membrane protein YdjX (TVP38/TMEM64 family) [Tumebacillus sp. BK434]
MTTKNHAVKALTKKLAILLIVVLLVVLVVVYQHDLSDLFSGAKDEPLAVFLIAVLFALVPAVPFGLVGALIGAMYGTLLGGLLTWGASTTAALLMFLFARYVFAEQAGKWLHRYEKIERFTRLFARNAFLAILFARLIPIIPAVAVNVYSAIARVPLRVYLGATALGKLPTMIVFVTMGEQAMSSWQNLMLVVLFYAVFLGIVSLIYKKVES